jgi:hypothetical protein
LEKDVIETNDWLNLSLKILDISGSFGIEESSPDSEI